VENPSLTLNNHFLFDHEEIGKGFDEISHLHPEPSDLHNHTKYEQTNWLRNIHEPYSEPPKKRAKKEADKTLGEDLSFALSEESKDVLGEDPSWHELNSDNPNQNSIPK